jgi:hypothetical protein
VYVLLLPIILDIIIIMKIDIKEEAIKYLKENKD